MTEHTEVHALSPSIAQLSIETLEPDPDNVRGKLHGLDELAASIRAHGIIQPLVVSAVGGGRYRIIAGHRRFEAARLAGMVDVPVVLRSVAPDATRAVQLVENIQREDLPAVDVAETLKVLMEQQGGDSDKVATQVGKSSSWVRRHLSLLNLDKKVLGAMRREGLGFEQATRAAQVFRKDGLNAALDAVAKLASGDMTSKRTLDPDNVRKGFAHKQRIKSSSQEFLAEIVMETNRELDDEKLLQVQLIMSALERVLCEEQALHEKSEAA